MRKFLTIPGILFLFILSIVLQTQMYQDWDMLYALEGSKRLLAGGTYVQDMFDNNPPLIFFFSIVVNLVSGFISASPVFVFKLLTYLVVIYSLCTCYYLLKKEVIVRGILVTLALCLLIVPGHCFGEREHLMIALALPYFFLLYQRGMGQDFGKISRTGISLFAAFGFALKPYFLFSLIFAELYFVFWQKKWQLIRLETLIIFSLILLYLISIAVFTPDYYQVILPLVMNFYSFNSNGMDYVLSNDALLNTFLLLLILPFLPRPLPVLTKFLIPVACGFALSFILQGKGWFYQTLPLTTIISLIAILSLYQLWYSTLQNRKIILIPLILAAQLLFTLQPVFTGYYNLMSCYLLENCEYPPLVKIAKEYASGKPIFFFSTALGLSMPIIYYSETALASRFPTMWLLSGIINRQEAQRVCDPVCQHGKKLLRQYVSEDFERYRPELVFVDINLEKFYIKTQLDYLGFMLKSPRFAREWQKYHYLTTSENYAIYQRDYI